MARAVNQDEGKLQTDGRNSNKTTDDGHALHRTHTLSCQERSGYRHIEGTMFRKWHAWYAHRETVAAISERFAGGSRPLLGRRSSRSNW
jgi:hypothetical protein